MILEDTKMRRKNTIRRISVLLIIGILAGCFLTGCSGSKDKPEMGRFVEKELSGLGNVISARTNAAGDLVVYSSETSGKFALTRTVFPKNGGAKETTELDWVNEFVGDGRSITDFEEAEDGTAYLLYIDDAAGAYKLICYQNGAAREIVIDGWTTFGGDMMMPDAGTPDDATQPDEDEPIEDDEDVTGLENSGASIDFGDSMQVYDGSSLYPVGVNALENGEFLITYSGEGVRRYDSDGNSLREYPGYPYTKGVVHKDKLAFLDAETSAVKVCDLAEGKELASYSYETDVFKFALAMDDENVYVADSGGIHRLTVDGVETIVDGNLTSLMLPTYNINQFIACGEDEFFCVLSDGEESSLMEYKFDETLSSEPSKVLNVFTLYDNNTIRQTIGVFQKKNPDVRVNLTVGMTEGSGATVEDVIRSLNTQFLNGTGPDLVVLDGLPIQSYIEKGVLVDISELVERLTASEGLMENMMNTYVKDGKTYAVPSRFTLPVMVGEGDVLSGISSLSDLAELVRSRQSESPALLVVPNDLWSNETGAMMKYYDALVQSFTNEDGSIDTAALAAYFADMLDIDRVLKENSPQTNNDITFVIGAAGSAAGFELVDPGSWSLAGGDARIHIQELIGMMGLTMLGSNLGDNENIELRTLFDNGLYYPVAGVGITSMSTNKQLAEQFIETLLSSEVQSKYLYDGYPVNASAMDIMIEENLLGEEPVSDMGFAELCKELASPVFVDDVIKNAVTDQISALLDGTITPEEAAQNVADKTRIYLAE